jgi:NAD dependent epimerase/dehydratase family enzyme
MLRLVLGEMSTLVLDGQRVLPTRLLAAGYRFQFPALRPALEDLIKT